MVVALCMIMRVAAKKFVPLPVASSMDYPVQKLLQGRIPPEGHVDDIEYIEAEIVDELESGQDVAVEADFGAYQQSEISQYVGTRTQHDAFQDLTRVNQSGYFEVSNRLSKYREPTLKNLDEYKSKILSAFTKV